jgi:hypothetical protein
VGARSDEPNLNRRTIARSSQVRAGPSFTGPRHEGANYLRQISAFRVAARRAVDKSILRAAVGSHARCRVSIERESEAVRLKRCLDDAERLGTDARVAGRAASEGHPLARATLCNRHWSVLGWLARRSSEARQAMRSLAEATAVGRHKGGASRIMRH